jgi:hypothetical protein
MIITLDSTNSWVDIPDDKELPEVQAQFHKVETWFYDLDGTHTKFPAKDIARRAVGTSHFDPKYLSWLTRNCFKYLRDGKSVDSVAWGEYVTSFLRSPEALEEVRQFISFDYVQRSLYSGVNACCQRRDKNKCYVTRNIREVAEPFAKILGISEIKAEAFDKAKCIEDYLSTHSTEQFFGVEGDSDEDAEMVDVLRFHKKEVVGVYVCDKLTSKPKQFEFATSHDRSALFSHIYNHRQDLLR